MQSAAESQSNIPTANSAQTSTTNAKAARPRASFNHIAGRYVLLSAATPRWHFSSGWLSGTPHAVLLRTRPMVQLG